MSRPFAKDRANPLYGVGQLSRMSRAPSRGKTVAVAAGPRWQGRRKWLRLWFQTSQQHIIGTPKNEGGAVIVPGVAIRSAATTNHGPVGRALVMH